MPEMTVPVHPVPWLLAEPPGAAHDAPN